MDKNQICGIYKIVDTINNKIYVGASHDILRRWENHRVSLKIGTGNKGMQASYNEHGLEHFKFEVIEECHPNLLGRRERFHIRTLDARNIDKGYNKTLPSAKVPKCKKCHHHVKGSRSHFCDIKPNTSYKILYSKEMQTSPKWCPRRCAS